MIMRSVTVAAGFTLIELLVVIAIIGMLASVILASLSGAKTKARDAERIMQLKQIQIAVESYAIANGRYPSGTCFSPWDNNVAFHQPWGCGAGAAAPIWNTLESQNYISSFPDDPVNHEGGTGNYLGDNAPVDLGYIYTSNGTNYILGTNLEANIGTASHCGNYQLTSSPAYACPL